MLHSRKNREIVTQNAITQKYHIISNSDKHIRVFSMLKVQSLRKQQDCCICISDMYKTKVEATTYTHNLSFLNQHFFGMYKSYNLFQSSSHFPPNPDMDGPCNTYSHPAFCTFLRLAFFFIGRVTYIYDKKVPIFTLSGPEDTVASASKKVCKIARSKKALPKSSTS